MSESARDRVCVVDRDPHVGRLLRQFLADSYEVEIFLDGYTALDCVRRSPPAVVISEILVPELDGLALCRLLKGDDATRHVPVLIFSMLAAAERATQWGADAFLAKPVERRALIATLQLLLPARERISRPLPNRESA